MNPSKEIYEGTAATVVDCC